MGRLESNRRVNEWLCLLALSLGLASQVLAVEDLWTPRTDMPTTRCMLGTCAVEGKIYAIAGQITHGPQDVGTAAVEVYDPATDTWASKGSMPKIEAGLAATVVDGKIYVIGGILDPRGTYAYDPATNIWTRKADMPTGRWALSGSMVNGKIYAIGGALTLDGPTVRTVEEYDPATDTWMRKADLPEPRYFHTAAVVGGKIYVIAGGPQAYVETATLFAYDPATDAWVRKADAPTVRAMASASALYGRIYVIGGAFGVNRTICLAGVGSGPYRPSVEEYDPATDTWTIKTDLPTPRANLSTVALNDKIYAIGGMRTWSDSLATVEEYDPYPLIVDFDTDGVVDIEDLLQLIESWGQADLTVDIGPRPFGDGIVDQEDLEIFMDHWGEEPGLVAKWKLDETEGTIACDNAGANDGTVIGIPAWLPAGGHIGGAMRFDGATLIAADTVLNPADGPFSVFAWVKGGGPGQAIVSQQSGANWLQANAPDGVLKTELKSAGRVSSLLTSGIVITDGDWHRVGFTWDGETRILYVDDAEVARDVQSSLAGSTGKLIVGAGGTLLPPKFWKGLIDDVRIYDRAVKP